MGYIRTLCIYTYVYVFVCVYDNIYHVYLQRRVFLSVRQVLLLVVHQWFRCVDSRTAAASTDAASLTTATITLDGFVVNSHRGCHHGRNVIYATAVGVHQNRV